VGNIVMELGRKILISWEERYEEAGKCCLDSFSLFGALEVNRAFSFCYGFHYTDTKQWLPGCSLGVSIARLIQEAATALVLSRGHIQC